MSLHNVKVVHNAAIQAGDILARNGAWNRKYLVVAITAAGEDDRSRHWVVELKFLGHYYASGRYVKARKSAANVDHLVMVPRYMFNGTAVASPPGGYALVEEI